MVRRMSFKKINLIIIIILLLSISLFTGCKKKATSYNDIKRITYQEILNQKSKNNIYYVMIYSTTCTYCETIESKIVDYYNYTKNKTLFNNTLVNNPLFVLNLNATIENKGIKANSDSDYLNFVGTTNYEDIKFSTAPAMLEITNGKVTKLISSKVTNYPVTEIENLLKSLKN